MYQSVIIPFPHRLLTKLAVIDICVWNRIAVVF
jgi:hypothetical protein